MSSTHPTRTRNRPGEGAKLSDDIVRAADALLAETGSAAQLSLRGVAREVGITAPAIYAHFATKNDLLAAVLARRFGHLARALMATPDTGDARSVVRARAQAYVDFGLSHPGLYAVLFGPQADHLGVVFEGSPGEQAFAAILEPVARAIEVPADDPRALALATDIWTAMHGIVTLRARLTGFPWGELERQLDRVVDQLLA
jgi:AcrR family transcriptional regulator